MSTYTKKLLESLDKSLNHNTVQPLNVTKRRIYDVRAITIKKAILQGNHKFYLDPNTKAKVLYNHELPNNEGFKLQIETIDDEVEIDVYYDQNKFNSSEYKRILDILYKQATYMTLNDNEDDLDESNVTANIDGYNTPNAFGGLPSKDTIEVFDYKQVSGKKKNVKKVKESTFRKAAKSLYNLNESKYNDVKRDKKASPNLKLNLAISEIHKKLFEIERIIDTNNKLKLEMGKEQRYWKPTKQKIVKTLQRLNRINTKIKNLN